MNDDATIKAMQKISESNAVLLDLLDHVCELEKRIKRLERENEDRLIWLDYFKGSE